MPPVARAQGATIADAGRDRNAVSSTAAAGRDRTTVVRRGRNAVAPAAVDPTPAAVDPTPAAVDPTPAALRRAFASTLCDTRGRVVFAASAVLTTVSILSAAGVFSTGGSCDDMCA